MTKDVSKGVEYALRGRHSEKPETEEVEEPVPKPPPSGKKRGRKPKKQYTPEELQALEEQKKKEVWRKTMTTWNKAKGEFDQEWAVDLWRH